MVHQIMDMEKLKFQSNVYEIDILGSQNQVKTMMTYPYHTSLMIISLQKNRIILSLKSRMRKKDVVWNEFFPENIETELYGYLTVHDGEMKPVENSK